MTVGSKLESLPKPPAFLDPLTTLDTCYFYSVPRFFTSDHPTNCWLTKRILRHDTEAIKRKLEVSPESMQDRYFQILDDPSQYQDDGDKDSMFHKKCLLYLTPLGLAVYFRSFEVVNLLLTFRTLQNLPLVSPNEAQYATHLQDSVDGDFHSFPVLQVLMRRAAFPAAPLLFQAGWKPNSPTAMPLRRRYERRVIYYRDWLDAGMALLSCRPSFSLALLAQWVTSSPGYEYNRLPIEASLKAKTSLLADGGKAKSKGPTEKLSKKSGKGSKKNADMSGAEYYKQPGILEFNNQPLTVPIVGVKHLGQLCDAVDRLRQTRQRAMDIRALLREAEANGINTEVLMAQASDDIAPDPKPVDSNENNDMMAAAASADDPSDAQKNRNNHAASGKKKSAAPSMATDQSPHCSEPVRILQLALERERCRQQCLDAVAVYVQRRGYFSFPQKFEPDHGRSRDLRNFAVSLLNVMASEQATIDKIVETIRGGHPRRRALEAGKQQRTLAIARISSILAAALVNSKEIMEFLSNTGLPYPYSSIDVDYHPRLSAAMTSIRYGVVRDLNANKDAWKYLTEEMLAQAVQDSAILLHFKVGKRPSKALIAEYGRKLDMQVKKKKK